MSELRITPDFENKRAEITGAASAGEKVRVILKNCSTKNTSTLRLRVLFAGKTLAVFPVEATEASQFTPEGDDLVCEINLCTDQMLKVFKRAIPELHVLFILDDPASNVRQMYFREYHVILGWPHDITDVPIDLSTYKDRMDEFDAAVKDAQKDIAEAIDDFAVAIDGKVDKETGKGLSTLDVSAETLNAFATRAELENHSTDLSRHVTPEDRANWDAKVEKKDLFVQNGYMYVPDVAFGKYRRMQAVYNGDMMSVTTVLSNELYYRVADGTFVMEEVE